jgi:WD40 repeat protein/serine/threonine protein kinase
MVKDRPSQTIQGYELLERIGGGGFGVVYRALQSTIGREVAVKSILPIYANEPNFIRRFEIEAQLIARLEHLHIVPLYDFWRDPEGAYIVMRWLRGGNLGRALRDGPFDLEPAGLLLDQVAAALAAAHEQQVVHCDVKPSNILLDEEGNAYLADFGIATDLRDGSKRIKEGEVVAGSLKYLSPEQLRGQSATPQSDIYSLGITLFEVLTGRHPFPARTSVQQIFQHIDQPLPRIENPDPAISEAINDVINKATAKNPANRYPDALALAAAFREAAQLDLNGQTDELVESLTLREQEILRLIVEGSSNKEIAQTLYVELPTVKWHITKIYKKLGVRSRVQAIVRARELNLIVFTDDYVLESDGSTRTSIVLPEPVNPYKGLMAFEPADNRHFFGREKLVETLLSKLAKTSTLAAPTKGQNSHGRFQAIIGPSGSGKSSLVKAGLIPALWSGKLPGSDKWYIVDMMPGARPVDELEIALTRIAANQAANLREHLDRDDHGLSRAAALVLPNDNSELLLIIDQFEELFTLVDEEEMRNHFIGLLYGAATDPRSRVRVIITLRADFYDRPLQYPAFGQLLRDHMETLLPLSAEELERAIVNPAEMTGVAFEPGLVATIIEDVNYRPGALPLLQYALTELFERREGRLLVSDAYEAIGGASGALAGRAEELYQEQEETGRELIHQMFLRLVTAGAPGDDPASGGAADGATPPDIRQRVLRSELLSAAADPDSLDEIIDTYAAYRLLSLDYHPVTRQPTVEVAHEAILREWVRLKNWLEESQADLALHRQLIRATGEWLEAGRDWSFLLRGSRLSQFEAWTAGSQIALTGQEQAFLDASLANRTERETIERQRQEHEAQLEQSSSRRLRALIAVMAVALVIAVGLTIAAIVLARQADDQRRQAVVRELTSAAQGNLESNPELSILLALEAAETTYSVDGSVLPEVEETLHRALQTARNQLTIPRDGVVSFSPDGKLLAIGSEDASVTLWDATTGEFILKMDGHDAAVLAVAFSPDGNYVATAGIDSAVKVWDVAYRNAVMRLEGHQGIIYDVAFSPDGERLASAGDDGQVRIWDIASLDTQETIMDQFGYATPALRRLDEPAISLPAPAVVTGVAFGPDGRKLAAYMPGESIMVWDSDSGEKLLKISSVSNFESGIAYSPDGAYLVGGSSLLGATIWDAYTGQQVITLLDSSPITSVEFSDDGTYLGTTARDGTAALWDMKTGRQTFRVAGQSTRFRFSAFSPDGTKMAMGSESDITRVWDLTLSGSAELFAIEAHEGEVFDVVYNSEGTRIVSSGEDGTVKIWDAATGKLTSNFPGRSDGMHYPTFSNDGQRLAAADNLGDVTIWDVDSGKELLTLSGAEQAVTVIAFMPDDSQLATAGQDGMGKIWDAETGELLAYFGDETEITWMDYSLDGQYIWSFNESGDVSTWDAQTGAPVTGPSPGGECEIGSWDSEPSVDGRYWAFAECGGLVYVYEAQDEPDEGTPTFAKLYVLPFHRGSVTGVAFNPEATVLVSVGWDGMAELWDMATGLELFTLVDQSIPLVAVDVSPDGRYVATGSSDGTISVYALGVDELITLARSRLSRGFTKVECQRYLHLPACPDEQP